MPSFVPRNLSVQQMNGTSPDYLAEYHNNTCGMSYLPPPPSYSAHQAGAMRSDNSSIGNGNRYGLQSKPSVSYSHQKPYLNPPPGLPVPSHIGGRVAPAPRLPPIQTRVQPPTSHEPTFLPELAPNPKEERAVGGVSARLDYELDMMADFVTNTTYNLVTKYIDCNKGLPSVPSAAYHKWVMQVLSATRLPSSTIFLSLYYLSKKLSSFGTRNRAQTTENAINTIVTVALIIGSKFFDDNTFINRSWAEVSGIDVQVLNATEREWLLSIGYHLHLDEEARTSCDRLRKIWDAHVVQTKAARAIRLSPIDTSFRHASPHSVASSNNRLGYDQKRNFPNFGAPLQSTYSATSAGSQYSPWNRTDESPASAPHTGPTTPEYYGTTNPWLPDRSFSYDRRSMFFGRQGSQHQTQQSTLGSGTYRNDALSPLHNNNYGYGTHGVMCTCSFCAGSRNVPYYNWAPQVVA